MHARKKPGLLKHGTLELLVRRLLLTRAGRKQLAAERGTRRRFAGAVDAILREA